MNIVLAAGGTAGHVNPMLATALELRKRGHNVVAVGTPGGMEKELVEATGIEFHTVQRAPFPRRPNKDALRFPVNYPRAVRQAMKILKKAQADVAVGFGGFASTPIYRAARRLGIPYVVHEQNALPGMANKFGARHAVAVGLTFPSTPLHAKNGETKTVGLPLRPAVATLTQADERHKARGSAAQKLGLNPSLPTLVITGGSLGAQHINEVMSKGAHALDSRGIQVLHLTGQGKDEPVREVIRGTKNYHVIPYLTEMEDAYACADLIICRAGAGTVAEVTALGIPAIFIPLPIGNGEQALNAKDVVERRGAILIPNEAFTQRSLASIMDLVRDQETLNKMSRVSASISPANGAQQLADVIEDIANA